jgi:hypothetical protein
MHITPHSPKDAERVFALQMIFLGLSVLLGLVVLIEYGSPGQRMSADGVYSAAPSYGVLRYPRPIEEYLEEDGSDSSGQDSSSASFRSASLSSNVRSVEYNRRTRRARGGLRARVTETENEGGFAPGWFWR